MWILQSLKTLYRTKRRPRIHDAQFWDVWWNEHISRRRIPRGFLFPMVEAPLVEYEGNYHDVVNNDDLLIAITLVQIRFLANRFGQHLTGPWWLRPFYETSIGP